MQPKVCEILHRFYGLWCNIACENCMSCHIMVISLVSLTIFCYKPLAVHGATLVWAIRIAKTHIQCKSDSVFSSAKI